MKQQKYFIGMDGGGTKTHALICDSDCEILAEHVGGPSNFQIIGLEKASETIYALMQSCCESVDCSIKDISVVACGLTGAGRTGDQERMTEGLKKYAAKKRTTLNRVIVESDARIALEGAFKGGEGIILIAGTGSIAFGKDAKGKVHRVGGWGRILGDEGSGYYLGRSGLTAVTHQLDGRGEQTKLTNMISKKFGLTDQIAIINAVYKNGFDVASIAPLVLDAASKKDRVCLLIVEQAAVMLAEHVKIASKKIIVSSKAKVRSKVKLAFVGGLIANETLLSDLLRRFIASHIPSVEIIKPMASPAYGAVIMAMEKK
ncbi:MAG: hypothetical protein HYV29_13000 [Ignavibacteriales bacterium]|nr:hypothetical protein [Ignavibacteriales bacterium]